MHLFSRPCPTPWVAAGVSVLGCMAGVMVTASHNPKDYSGCGGGGAGMGYAERGESQGVCGGGVTGGVGYLMGRGGAYMAIVLQSMYQ